MTRYVYLGKRVRDIRNKGYDTPIEGKRIADAIVEDYRRGRISYRTAMSRLNLLELITKKNSKLRSGKREVREYIDKKRKELMRLRERRRR
ncbi:MAG: hypothetical protein QXG48_05410 [Thermofilaceae archaeon]